MSAPAPAPPPIHDPYASLRVPDFRLFLAGRLTTVVGEMMVATAVEYEVYARTKSAMALGVVGLVQVLPVILLALPAGQVADLFDRRRVVLAAQGLAVLCAAGLALATYASAELAGLGLPPLVNAPLEWAARALGETGADFSDPALTPMYVLILLLWVARTFNNAARGAMVAEIVTGPAFPNAVTWNSSVFQAASVAGPALGGLVLGAVGPATCYAAASVGMAGYWLCILLMERRGVAPRRREPPTLASLAAGIRFVGSHPLLLATITLDLFAVLLGGVTALIPMFADRLGVGPEGMGLMKTAPAVGAILTALLMAHRPPMRKAGVALIRAVIGFGLVNIGFGLSEWFLLSLLMLALNGATDMVSVVVRDTLVQLLTPDEMRGRVSAVNNVFIGSSNQLGAFRCGASAAAFGPVTAVVAGGACTILTVLWAAWMWPELRRLGRLEDVTPVKA